MVKLESILETERATLALDQSGQRDEVLNRFRGGDFGTVRSSKIWPASNRRTGVYPLDPRQRVLITADSLSGFAVVMMEDERFVSTKEAADILGVTSHYLYRLARSGRFKRFETKIRRGRGGQHLRFDLFEILAENQISEVPDGQLKRPHSN